MADTIRKVKVVDDIIATESEVQYGVLVGGQNVTAQEFKAISATPNSMVFNIVVPSLETILDRHLMISATFTLKITYKNTAGGTTLPAGTCLVNYGVTDALANFPLNRLISTIQCSINNNTISLQQSDVFDILTRLYDPDSLAKYDGKTPTTCDYLSDYGDGVEALKYIIDWNQNAAAGSANINAYQVGVAATPIAGSLGSREQAYLSHTHNVLGFDSIRTAGSSHYHRPRGIFVIDKIFTSTGTDYTPTGLPNKDSNEVYVQFTVKEPLFLSPFLVGADSEGHHPGMYGINNMNLTINFLNSANRAWRSAAFPLGTGTNPAYFSKEVSLVKVSDAKIECKFYTPKGSMLQNPRCVVNYHEIGIYRTSNFKTIPAPTADKRLHGIMTVGGFPIWNTAQLTSSNIQLSCIPDKIIVCARRIQSLLKPIDADTYLVVNNIRVNFNNTSGLLATFTQEQLYDASVSSGLKNLTWEEFSGATIGPAADVDHTKYNGWQRNAYSGTGATDTSVGFKQIPTTGSILVLDMGRVIQLPQEFDAPGNIGQFSLQVIVDAANPHKQDWNANEYELVILVVNAGVLITQQGSSSSYIGLLTKSDTLATIEEPEFITHSHMNKLTGGSFLGSLKNAMHWVHSKITPMKNWVAQHIDHPIANKAVEVASALGYGMTGGKNHKLHDRLM